MTQFIDARTATLSEPVHADVCIVGAGAAGITLAANLADSGLKVIMLESGAREIEGATQDLYEAEQTGIPYYDMTSCRLRFFGGTTNHWGGYCRENDPIDYAGRPDLGVPAWPLSYDQIAPYVTQAAKQLGLTREGFDPHLQAARHGFSDKDLLESHSDDFVSKVFQISVRRRFQELYADTLAKQTNVDLYLNANVTQLNVNPQGNRIDGLTVRALGRPPFQVKAKRYVLAAHAVENARLLMAADEVVPGGLGNKSGQLGRNFMEHPYVESGLLFPSPSFPRFYDADTLGRLHLNANLSFSEKAMRREGMLQYYCRFRPLYGYEESLKALSTLKSGFWAPADMRTLDAVGTVLRQPTESARLVASRAGLMRPKPIAFLLDHRIEQSPNPDSRITLSSERDELGVRKVVLHWSLSDLDCHTFAKGQEVTIRELTRLQAGRFEAPPLTPALVRAHAKGHYHHIGTARMAASERDGVVDVNTKVFGMANLYVAGSAIFPTSGYSGPTMMVIAFAIRLAEHLKQTTAREAA